MRKVFELRLFHSWQEITYSYLCQGKWMGCRPVCTENIYGFLQALLQTGTLWVWWHYILDTSVNKIDYVKQQYIKCSNKSKWKCHLYLGGSVRKASLFHASGIFSNFFFRVQVYDGVGSAVRFHSLNYMKEQGNVLFWSVKRPKGY